MLLILPVFLTIIFVIMEMGYLAFWVIVINHATYECARIGSMLATPTPAGGEPRDVNADMQKIMDRFLRGARVISFRENTVEDSQARHTNKDLIVTGSYDVRLVFPISSILMSTPLLCPQGPGGGSCTMKATVRMPIERPLRF